MLPIISNLSSLTYLEILDDTEDTTLSVYLLQRGMRLRHLNRIGFNNWSLLLNCLEFCTNLVQLKLWNTTLPNNDVTQWSRAVNK